MLEEKIAALDLESKDLQVKNKIASELNIELEERIE
jgi:hypothetical protein